MSFKRTIRRSKSTDPDTLQNFDAVAKALSDIPAIWYQDFKILEISFELLALDQTLAHKLPGPYNGWFPVRVSGTSAFIQFREDTPASNLANTHIRLIANGVCEAKILVWR